MDEKKLDHFDEENEEIIRCISLELKIPTYMVREAVMSEFAFVAKVMRSGSLKSVRLRHMGVFILNKRGWYKWYLRECEREEQRKIAESEKERDRETGRYTQRVEKRDMEESESRTNGEDTGGDLRPMQPQLV